MSRADQIAVGQTVRYADSPRPDAIRRTMLVESVTTTGSGAVRIAGRRLRATDLVRTRRRAVKILLVDEDVEIIR